MPVDGMHQCCRWENRDFDTSLFFGSSSTNGCPLDQQHAYLDFGSRT